MNRDESILQEQYSRDEETVEGLEKVWMILDLSKEIVIEGEDCDAVRYVWNEYKGIESFNELGWIYSRDICADFYKYFNVVESYER